MVADGSLPPLPADPSNKYADDVRAAVLGQKLFFDTRFRSNGKVACGIFPGSFGCRGGHGLDHEALVSWLMVVQIDFRAYIGKIV